MDFQDWLWAGFLFFLVFLVLCMGVYDELKNTPDDDEELRGAGFWRPRRWAGEGKPSWWER